MDVFLAARKVGPEGKAIGVDMTKVRYCGLNNPVFLELTGLTGYDQAGK